MVNREIGKEPLSTHTFRRRLGSAALVLTAVTTMIIGSNGIASAITLYDKFDRPCIIEERSDPAGDCQNMDFSGITFRPGTNLSSVNFTGTKFIGAALWKAILKNANLTGANLTNAKMIDAKLEGPKMTMENAH